MSKKKKGIIFDLDGVLVNSMPTHVQAWKAAFSKVAGIEVSDREIYLLEGMRGIELVTKIFEQKNLHFASSQKQRSLAKKVKDEKDRIFKIIRSSEPFEGVKEIIMTARANIHDGNGGMTKNYCRLAVVSGSSRRDVKTILDEAFGRDDDSKKFFDVVITADDVKKGKPNPSAFLEALKRMKIQEPSEAIVVENAPLGVEAANNAGIDCYVVLNNTPLTRSDFNGLVPPDRILERTCSLKALLHELCYCEKKSQQS